MARWALFLVNPFDSSCFTASDSDSIFSGCPVACSPTSAARMAPRTDTCNDDRWRTQVSELAAPAIIRGSAWYVERGKSLFAFAMFGFSSSCLPPFPAAKSSRAGISHSVRGSLTTFVLSSPVTIAFSRSSHISQRMRFALKHVGAHIVAHERPGVFAAQLMPTMAATRSSAIPISASMVANVRRGHGW